MHMPCLAMPCLAMPAHKLLYIQYLCAQVTNGEPGFLAFETRFWFPSIRSGSGTALYYSYEVAAAHIIMLGSYADYGQDSAQFAWLQRDLASIDRGRTPWVIVGMHIPWYSSNEQHQGEVSLGIFVVDMWT